MKWKPAGVEDLDSRVGLGYGGQAWYGSTWVYAPAETELTFDLQSHRMTTVRWSINGQKLAVPDKDYKEVGVKGARTVATRPVTLRAGWNQIFFRAYNFGYALGVPFRVGVVIKAPPEKLWPLRLSNTPPAP